MTKADAVVSIGGTLAGVVIGWLLSSTAGWLARRRRRQALATALISDVGRLSAFTHQFQSGPFVATPRPIPATPILDRYWDCIEHLDARAITAIAFLQHIVADARDSRAPAPLYFDTLTPAIDNAWNELCRSGADVRRAIKGLPRKPEAA